MRTFEGGFGGTGIDANMAAVEDCEVKMLNCGGLVGVVCGGLLLPLSEVLSSGRDTINGLFTGGTGCGFCLARATALVSLAAATADTFVEALAVFFTPPVLATDAFELALLATAWRRAAVLAMPCLVGWEEACTEEVTAEGLAGYSTNMSLHLVI